MSSLPDRFEQVGIVVGWLVATDRLPVSYRAVWLFGVGSYVLVLAGWVAFALGFPPADAATAVGVWVGMILVAAGVTWMAPGTRAVERAA